MEPIPPVSKEMAELWNFLSSLGGLSDAEARACLRRSIKGGWAETVRQDMKRLEHFLTSEPPAYQVLYTVEVAMNWGIDGPDEGLAVLNHVLTLTKEVLSEPVEQE